LKTDEHGRVLRTDGSIITGLFGVGNSMASVMGNSYPGAGATLGPAMTFGYLAAQCAANETDDHLKY
jgi:succinate dehydrogenase/fumarate reductase flavoprotein subunit